MRSPKKIAILGAGAMGSVLASRFLEVPEFTTVLIARDERRARLLRDGLTVNGGTFHLPVEGPDTETAPADLIIVALKHHQLRPALNDLSSVVGPQTLMLSVMNGLDSETILGGAYGPEKVLYCISVGIDALRQNGQVTYTTVGKLYLGEAANPRISAKVRGVQEILDRAQIPYETPPDMLRMLWWKFMINVGTNQASAIMRSPYGVLQTSDDARAVMFGLMREVLALAERVGVDLNEGDLDAWDTFLHTLSPGGKTSMLQDVEAGRKTEVEIFAGKAVELGQQYEVPTPMNAMAHHVIRVLEQSAVHQGNTPSSGT